jgi:hypothetical protein
VDEGTPTSSRLNSRMQGMWRAGGSSSHNSDSPTRGTQERSTQGRHFLLILRPQMKSKTSPGEQCQAPAENENASALRLENIVALAQFEEMSGMGPAGECTSQAISCEWPIL